MRQTVVVVIIAAAPIAAIAVIGMIALGLHEGDGLASTISGNLQAIALSIVVAMAGVVSHFIGAGGGVAATPTQQQQQPAVPAAPASAPPGGTSDPAGA